MLITPAPIRRKRRVEILILGERSICSFRVKGRVRWIEEDATRLGTPYFLVGIEFDPMPEGAHRLVKRLMEEPVRRTSTRRRSASGSARWNPPFRPSDRTSPVSHDTGRRRD